VTELQDCDSTDPLTNDEWDTLRRLREAIIEGETSPGAVALANDLVARSASALIRRRVGERAHAAIREFVDTAAATKFDADSQRVHLTLPYEVWDQLQEFA